MVKFTNRLRFIPNPLATTRRARSVATLARKPLSKPATRSRLPARRLAGYRTRAAQMFKKRRNPMKRIMARPTIGGVPSFSSLRLVKYPSPQVRSIKKVAAANHYITNEANQLKVSEGFQSATFYGFQTLNDLKFMASKVPVGTTLPVTPYKRFVVESLTAQFLITNSSLATQYMDIYDIVRKRDDPGMNAGGATVASDPLSAWQDGMFHGESGLDLSGNRILNSLPTDSDTFKDWFKVIRRSHIALSQGATHRHNVLIKANKLVDTALLNNADGDLAGWSVYTMIVCYGQPVSIPGEGPTVVTTAAGVIDVVRACRYKFTWCQDTNNNIYTVDGLSTLTGEKVVSLGAGQIVDNDYI